ncbi:MAG: hypothetical protein R2838_20010 [Caldilineaceae bacterium]
MSVTVSMNGLYAPRRCGYDAAFFPLILLTLTLVLPPAPAAQPGVTCDVAHVTIADTLHTPRPCRDPIRLNGRMLVLTDLLAGRGAERTVRAHAGSLPAGRPHRTPVRLDRGRQARRRGHLDLLRDPPVCEIAATGDFRLLDLDTKARTPSPFTSTPSSPAATSAGRPSAL